MNKKIGLFGGTFNPPHIGHFLLAKGVKDEFKLDEVIFIPAFIPPHKDPKKVIEPEHRKNMVKLLIENELSFILSEYEINKKTISYSIDTIKYFKTELLNDELFFLIGSDAFYYIDTWKDYKEVLGLIKFIIFLRKGFTKDMIIKKYGNLENILWANIKMIDISSSDIRLRIRKGENCIKEVGEKVWKYIVEHTLYR